MPEISMTELLARLSDLPAEKARAAAEYETAYERLQDAKHRAKLVRARALLRLKALEGSLRKDELESRVETDVDVVQAAQESVRAESAARRLEIEVSRYDDLFTGAKMVARIRIAEMGGGLLREHRAGEGRHAELG